MVKQQVWQFAKSYQELKIAETKDTIKKVQESGNNEQKSSMGDKYETARAMSQNEIYMLSQQLEVLQQEYQKLLRIQPDKPCMIGELGALVQTETSTCFIAAAIGSLNIENQKIAIISEQSPLAKALLKKKIGEKIELAGKSIKILNIL